MKPIDDVRQISAITYGFLASKALFAALDLDLFTKIAGGNVCTEDLVHMFQHMGVRTDIHLDGIVAVAREVAAYFHRDMPGMIYKTGPIRSTQG